MLFNIRQYGKNFIMHRLVEHFASIIISQHTHVHLLFLHVDPAARLWSIHICFRSQRKSFIPISFSIYKKPFIIGNLEQMRRPFIKQVAV